MRAGRGTHRVRDLGWDVWRLEHIGARILQRESQCPVQPNSYARKEVKENKLTISGKAAYLDMSAAAEEAAEGALS